MNSDWASSFFARILLTFAVFAFFYWGLNGPGWFAGGMAYIEYLFFGLTEYNPRRRNEI